MTKIWTCPLCRERPVDPHLALANHDGTAIFKVCADCYRAATGVQQMSIGTRTPPDG